jgi:hypothetical protein
VSRPDPSTVEWHELDRADVAVERQYGLPSFVVAERLSDPEGVPADVLSSWRAADERRCQLIDATRGEPGYVTNDVEPMERRKDRLPKPGPSR